MKHKNIIGEISSLRQLKRAWKHASRNWFAAVGVDRQTVEEFSTNYEQNLIGIGNEIRKGTYEFYPLRESKIPKANKNEKRTIHVMTIQDKIVQHSIRLSLDRERNSLGKKSLIQDTINGVSIAYVGRLSRQDPTGVKASIKKAKECYSEGKVIFSIVDIVSFFDNINYEILRTQLNKILEKDRSADWLIDQCINPKVITKDISKTDENPITKSGVLQGAVLAPMLSNIFMIPFDKEVETKKIPVLRYADDLIIFSRTKEEARNNYNQVSGILNKLSLEFHKPGSKKGVRHQDLSKPGASITYLGIKYMNKARKSLDVGISEEKIKHALEKVDIMLDPNNDGPLINVIWKANNSVRSRLNYYGSVGCHRKHVVNLARNIKKRYYDKVNNLLIKKGITDKALDASTLNYVGILDPKTRENWLGK